MPFMEARDLQLMTSAITSRDSKIEAKNRVIEKLNAQNKYMVIGEAALGAGAFGFLRGWYEDPATGAAAAALAGYMALREPGLEGTFKWEVVQGVDMGRPSRLYVEADKHEGRTTAVRVGGTAIVIGNGVLRI